MDANGRECIESELAYAVIGCAMAVIRVIAFVKRWSIKNLLVFKICVHSRPFAVKQFRLSSF